MKTTVIRSSWLSGYGHRLDTRPYVGGALETKVLLERLPLTKELVRDLVLPDYGGIYFAGREGVTWVDSPEYGIPFLRGKDIQLADLSESPFISKRQVETNPTFLIRKGMTLITRSGTIGKTAYVRADMDGMATSDPLRVVPDPNKIPSGFLYAYLSSKFGVPLLASGAYGAIIQHLEPSDIASIPVPRLGDALEHEIHELVEKAAELRSQAAAEINATTNELRQALGLKSLRHANVRGTGINTVLSSQLNCRLDATYHSTAAAEADKALRKCSVPIKKLADVTARLFKPPMFKRLWVESPNEGVEFTSGNEAYNLQAEDVRYVSLRTPNFDEFIVRRGWLIFQAAGQIYGLFARPLLVHGWLDGLFIADDMYRIVPNEPEDGGFLFAFFRTDVGEVLIKRQSAGNSIPRVHDPQMKQLLVPWPEKEERHGFGKRVIAAHEKYFRALKADRQAIQLVQNAIEGNGR